MKKQQYVLLCDSPDRRNVIDLDLPLALPPTEDPVATAHQLVAKLEALGYSLEGEVAEDGAFYMHQCIGRYQKNNARRWARIWCNAYPVAD